MVAKSMTTMNKTMHCFCDSSFTNAQLLEAVSFGILNFIIHCGQKAFLILIYIVDKKNTLSTSVGQNRSCNLSLILASLQDASLADLYLIKFAVSA